MASSGSHSSTLYDLERLQAAVRQAGLEPMGAAPAQWRDPVFLNNLGAALQGAGQPDLALQAFDCAAGLKPGEAGVQFNRAGALLALGRGEDAVRAAQAAIELDPGHAEGPGRLGEALLRTGQAAAATPWLERAVRRGGAAEASANLSAALVQLNRPAEAAEACREGLKRHPASSALLANLGVALLQLKAPADAAEAFARAICLTPRSAPAALGLARALEAAGKPDEAAAALDAFCAREPSSAASWHQLGALRLKLGQPAGAEAACRAAVAAQPRYAPAYIGLGAALRRLDRREEAAQAYRSALALEPRNATAHYNLANVLQDLDDGPEPGAAYAEAIRLKPDWPSAHYNFSIWLLRQGRWAEGWEEYEWRWRTEAFKAARPAPDAPLWAGQSLAGKTILVRSEQGHGDMIQCARYVPLLAARGARVRLEAPPALAGLFGRLEGVERVLAPGEAPGPIDFQCPAMSLPRGFAVRVDADPATAPYLSADPARVAPWRERLGEGFKVGVAWQGNPKAAVEHGRSFPLAALAPLAAVPGVRLISLQKIDGLDQLAEPGLPIQTLGPDYDRGDFAETAAVIAALDLVVACDTAVGHLAGALGKPVWLAIKSANDWRWLRGRSDTPWYPSMTLYRQKQRGVWSDGFQAMARDLKARVRRG